MTTTRKIAGYTWTHHTNPDTGRDRWSTKIDGTSYHAQRTPMGGWMLRQGVQWVGDGYPRLRDAIQAAVTLAAVAPTRGALEEQERDLAADLQRRQARGWALVGEAQQADSHTGALGLLRAAVRSLEQAELDRAALATVRDAIHNVRLAQAAPTGTPSTPQGLRVTGYDDQGLADVELVEAGDTHGAYCELVELVEAGREYPDAHAQVCSRYRLTTEQGEDVQGMYDARD